MSTKPILAIEPRENIKFAADDRKQLLEITNKSFMPQAYKIKCTRNDIFRVSNAIGLLAPRETKRIAITFKTKDEKVDDRNHLGVYHIPAPEGCTPDGVWAEHYGAPCGEHRIKIHVSGDGSMRR